MSAGLEIVKEHSTIDPAQYGDRQNAFIKNLNAEPAGIKRSLGLSPTTEMAKAKGIGVSQEHFVKSSVEYGNRIPHLPTLNDPTYHRNNNIKNFSYNVLTGSYVKR